MFTRIQSEATQAEKAAALAKLEKRRAGGGAQMVFGKTVHVNQYFLHTTQQSTVFTERINRDAVLR